MKYSKLALIALGSVSVSMFYAQDSVTVADYKRAESRLFYKTAPWWNVMNALHGIKMVKDLNIPKLHQPESSLMLMLFSKKTKTEAVIQTGQRNPNSPITPPQRKNNKPGILSPDGKN